MGQDTNSVGIQYKAVNALDNPLWQWVPVIGSYFTYVKVQHFAKELYEYKAIYGEFLEPQTIQQKTPLAGRLEFLKKLKKQFKETAENATNGWCVRFLAWIICAIILSPFLWIGFVVDCLFIHHFAVEKEVEKVDAELSGLIHPLEEALSKTYYPPRDKKLPDLFDTPFHRERGYLGNGQWDLTLSRVRV